MKGTITSYVQAGGELSELEPYAVRWVKRLAVRINQPEYSQWHWTKDGNFTSCGVVIPIVSTDGYVAETDDLREKVTCKRCLREK